MAPKSRLPAGGQNLFGRIKAQTEKAEALGVKVLKLSIGEPQGPALMVARQGVANAVLSDSEDMHRYQDNGSPGVPEFPEEFVHFHTGDLGGANVACSPIPGIKAMLEYVIQACGNAHHSVHVLTMTNPGYPTPADCCANLCNIQHSAIHLHPDNSFRFDPYGFNLLTGQETVMMLNYPHNPSGQVATEEQLDRLCEFCAKRRIRIFNDAAYAGLAHVDDCTPLANIAVRHPELSWAEAFSASKIIRNGTGWRVGAMVGSLDFIGDIETIKGNRDSGYCAFVAAGVLEAIRTDQEGIAECRRTYHRRIQLLKEVLGSHNMELAVEPGAGFFTLWQAPTFAFGQQVEDGEQFNNLMIEKTGVVGVPFGSYIRYAVVGPVEEMRRDLEIAFDAAEVGYAVE
jgi:LL-diaminopimelate aminotransferase